MKKLKILALLCILLLSACAKGNATTQEQPQKTASPAPANTPAKNETVGNDVRKPMDTQLTQEQVKGMFGDKYTEVTDAVTGEWKVWRYDIIPKSGYKYETTTSTVDTQGIKNQDVKGQVFVTWSPDGKLMSIVYYGLKDGAVNAYYINGFTEENAG